MKVLIISHMYPSKYNETIGIFVHEQVRALMSKGVGVRVVSPIPWIPFPIRYIRRRWRMMAQIPNQTVWEGVQVWYPRYVTFPRSWFLASSGKRMYWGIKNLVERLQKEFQFDLIPAHVALPDGYAGALLARKLGVPLVVTIHGQDLQYTVYRCARCRHALGFTFGYASRVIVVSTKLKRLAEEHFGCSDKIVVIPNGVDPAKVLQPNPKRPRNYPAGTQILLSVSNLIQTKGIDLNLRAIQRLCKKYPALQYKIVGAGPLEMELKKLAVTLGVSNNVEFIGPLPHFHVMERMAECDIFVLPSWKEGFGVVYLEAMASGKPVIGCKGQGIEDVIEHGKTGLLVEPRDVDSLVEALDFLLSHPDEAKAMGERARNLVLENYTWEKNAEKTIAVYREVLDER